MLKAITQQTAELLDVLPDEDIFTVNKLVKKMVLAWDPDFTKVTAREKRILETADDEFSRGDYISEEEFWK